MDHFFLQSFPYKNEFSYNIWKKNKIFYQNGNPQIEFGGYFYGFGSKIFNKNEKAYIG